MKRRDVVRALLTPDPITPAAEPAQPPEPPAVRVPSHAVRAMGLEIGRLAEAARDAGALRAQIEGGAAVVALDPALVDPSFARDRLARVDDADYRRLVSSLRDSGQQIPVLVRPHPEHAGRYQIAYGHRRRDAAAELGIRLLAIIRPLDDAALVIAQGKENAERRNLSFIERALFAAGLQARGFDRATINAALGVHTAETTRLLAVAAAVPAVLVHAIGPAPKAGRPRWMELAGYVSRPGIAADVATFLDTAAMRRLASDRRFDAVLARLRGAAMPAELAIEGTEVIRNRRGQVVIRVEHAPGALRLAIDLRLAPTLAPLLLRDLPELVRQCDEDAA